MKKITIVVIDDHPLFRQGVVDTLSLEDDLIVVGDAPNGEDGLELIRDLKPLVAVVDVNLPGMNGQQVTRHVVGEKIPTRVVLLTAYDDAEQKIHALRVGAFGYCTKDILPEELVHAVRQVVAGKYVVSNRVHDQEIVGDWLVDKSEGEFLLEEYAEQQQPLSTREMEVLELVTTGLSNKEIAATLGISHQTVKNHVTAILRKLCVEDRTQAALYALRRGWVRLYK